MIDDEIPQTPVKEEVEPSSTPPPPPPSEEVKEEEEGKTKELEVQGEAAIKEGERAQEGLSKEADPSASNLVAAIDKDDSSTEVSGYIVLFVSNSLSIVSF